MNALVGAFPWGTRTLLGALACLACFVSCATLPAIPRGVCGNGIVEPGEDCDRFDGEPGTSCQACRFRCTPLESGGPTPVCPDGWACGGADGICRAASGQFRVLTETPSDAFRVSVAPVDGDRVGDVVATSVSRTRVRFSVSDFAASFDIPSMGRAPAIAHLTPDARADLLFTTNEISVWQGQADRTLLPAAYPALVLPKEGGEIRIVAADAYAAFSPTRTFPGDEVFVFGALEDRKPIVALRAGIRLIPLQPLRALARELAGDFQVGDAREGDGACPEIAFAFLGRDEVELFEPCRAAFDGDVAAMPTEPPPPVVRLRGDGDAPLGVGPRGVLFADVDGDGHLDLLVDGVTNPSDPPEFWQPTVLLALGAGDGTFRSVPGDDRPSAVGVARPLGGRLAASFKRRNVFQFPLAAGALTADALADFVFEERVVLRSSRSGEEDAGPGNESGTGGPLGRLDVLDAPNGHAWTEAKIGDFNADGVSDFVAAWGLGLDFYAGSARPPLMNVFSHAVLGGASRLGVGDFDGDRAVDVVFASGEDLFVAYGKLSGGPSAPEPIGRFPGVKQLTTGVIRVGNETPDALADIGVIGSSATAELVSIVRGSTDRRLLSPYQLTRVDAEQRILQAASIAAAVGEFDAAPGADLAVLAVGPRAGADGTPAVLASLWSVPGFGDAGSSPRATEGLTLGRANDEARLPFDVRTASMAAIDLDAPSENARQEIVLVARPRSTLIGEDLTTGPGKLIVARMTGDTWESAEEVELGGRVGSVIPWKVEAVDIDGDGADDLVVLYEEGGSTTVSVHFNHRDGRLDPAPIKLTLPDRVIVDFAALQADGNPNKELVLMTRDPQLPSEGAPESDRSGLHLVHVVERAFSSPSGPLTEGGASGASARKLPGASGRGSGDGVAAGDVDGDGVDDLIVQRGGALIVLQGLPAVRP